jgi:hypothetical protein
MNAYPHHTLRQNPRHTPSHDADEFFLLVPKSEHVDKWSLKILPGSAIVGRITSLGMCQLHFEGDLHVSNACSFPDRVMRAWGRLSKNYPTIARAQGPMDEFHVAGTVSAGVVTDGSDDEAGAAALQHWQSLDKRLGVEPAVSAREKNRTI